MDLSVSKCVFFFCFFYVKNDLNVQTVNNTCAQYNKNTIISTLILIVMSSQECRLVKKIFLLAITVINMNGQPGVVQHHSFLFITCNILSPISTLLTLKPGSFSLRLLHSHAAQQRLSSISFMLLLPSPTPAA